MLVTRIVAKAHSLTISAGDAKRLEVFKRMGYLPADPSEIQHLLFVHQWLPEIGSDGSLALCSWQVIDRIRLRQYLSPCSHHLLNTLLNSRHSNKSISTRSFAIATFPIFGLSCLSESEVVLIFGTLCGNPQIVLIFGPVLIWGGGLSKQLLPASPQPTLLC